MSGTRLNVRALAAQALAPALAGKGSLGETLPSAVAACRPEDRGLLQALCFTAARHGLHYRAILKPLLAKSPEPLVEALLWVGLAQLRELRVPDHAAIGETVEAARQLGRAKFTGLLNAILRRYQREKDELEARAQGLQHAHPDWLVQQLRKDWDAAATDILTANNTEAPLTLRVNRRHLSRDDYARHLQDAGIASEPCQHAPDGLRVAAVGDVRKLPGFEQGWFSVQDEAAQLAAALLAAQPGHRVLDACAAPGGKTAHLLEHTPDCHVLALDSDAQRNTRVRENLNRLQLDADVRTADAGTPERWWDGVAFDRILLDAPCTATGVIRRHPDIKLLRRPGDVAQTVAQQQRLLDALWPLLAPGGRLLYATCSLLKAENEAQIARFLGAHADAREQPLAMAAGEARPQGRQLLPQDNGHDGFYYALLEKTSAE
jgi:16S rRNA (cytosine967-C5)-methyltransferase